MKAKIIALCVLLSACNLYAANWQASGLGVFNDMFEVDIDYLSVDVLSGTNEDQFNQSVGNVIDYWQSLLINHTPSERINVYIEFTDTAALALAGASYNSSITTEGKSDYANKTHTLDNYTTYETSNGLKYNYITNAQAKLQGYTPSKSTYDIHIEFTDFSKFNAATGKNYSYHYGAVEDIGFYNYDFETILLHEITHGLGMLNIKFKNSDGGTTTTLNQRQITHDDTTWLNVLDPDGNPVYYETAWDALLSMNMTGQLDYQPGANINIEVGDLTVPIYNPDPYKEGSSLAHPIESDELNYVMGFMTFNSQAQREFHTNELYMLEALGYDIEGISLKTIPEPATSTLGLIALSGLLLHRRRKARL